MILIQSRCNALRIEILYVILLENRSKHLVCMLCALFRKYAESIALWDFMRYSYRTNIHRWAGGRKINQRKSIHRFSFCSNGWEKQFCLKNDWRKNFRDWVFSTQRFKSKNHTNCLILRFANLKFSISSSIIQFKVVSSFKFSSFVGFQLDNRQSFPHCNYEIAIHDWILLHFMWVENG